ncbi:MAG: acyloxyacyl hydrolase [Cyanobacteria bacterium P01_F01_bin.150]
MNHQLQTHSFSEQHLVTNCNANLLFQSRWICKGVVGSSLAIATAVGVLSNGILVAGAVPILEAPPLTDAKSLSKSVLVPEVQDDTPIGLSQILAQASPDSTSSDNPDSTSGNNVDDNELRFGDRGDNRWYVQAAAATTLDDDEARRLGLVGAGLSHFFLNGHSINLELNGLAFDQTGDDAVGLNLNAMLRWHLHRADNWSVYVDGGAGLLGTTNDVPAAGSQLNFTPQVGAGATIRLKDEQRLMVGLRWHHISNADLYPPNPGRDSLYGYVGWNLPR